MIEMPRSFSSWSGSVSIPVSAKNKCRLAVVHMADDAERGIVHPRIRSRADATSADSSSVTVRMSRMTESFSIRPMMGGSFSRRSFSNSCAGTPSVSSAARMLGMASSGSEPPPEYPAPSRTATDNPSTPLSFSRKFSARFVRPSSVCVRRASSGQGLRETLFMKV